MITRYLPSLTVALVLAVPCMGQTSEAISPNNQVPESETVSADLSAAERKRLVSQSDTLREKLLNDLQLAIQEANCQTNEDVAAVTSQFKRTRFSDYVELQAIDFRLARDARTRAESSIISENTAYQLELIAQVEEASSDAERAELKAALALSRQLSILDQQAAPKE